MRFLRRLAIVSIIGVFWIALVAGCARWEPYKVYPSPDGRYQVEVLRKLGTSTMPGQGGDVLGRVRLVRNGHVLKEAEVELASAVDAPTWTTKMVSIRMVAEWALE